MRHTNVRPKRLVAFRLIPLLHFFDRLVAKRSRLARRLPPELPLLTGLLELAIACRMKLLLSSSEHIVWRHVSDVRGFAAETSTSFETVTGCSLVEVLLSRRPSRYCFRQRKI